jgi:hypothetical protein
MPGPTSTCLRGEARLRLFGPLPQPRQRQDPSAARGQIGAAKPSSTGYCRSDLIPSDSSFGADLRWGWHVRRLAADAG